MSVDDWRLLHHAANLNNLLDRELKKLQLPPEEEWEVVRRIGRFALAGKDETVKTGDVFPSRYLRGADIEDREQPATVSHVAMEEVADGEKKPVVHFRGVTKGVVLNKTNWDRLVQISGSDDSDDWGGIKVVLYTELVPFQGKTSPAIRIKKPPHGTAQPRAVDDMEDEVPFK